MLPETFSISIPLLTEVSICAGKRRRRDLCLDLTLPQSMIVDESNQFIKQVLKAVWGNK
jgi:hypothetical protein